MTHCRNFLTLCKPDYQHAIKNEHVIFCTCNYGKISIIYDHTKISSEEILTCTDPLHTNLQFKPTHEINPIINFLDLLTCMNIQGLDTDIYRKLTSTDTTNYFSSNHLTEQKLAAYRYLKNRMHSLPLNTKNKHKEWNTILHIAKTNGFRYSRISKLNTQVTRELYLPPSHNNTLFNQEKWDTFIYYNPMTRKITNHLKSTNIQITFRKNNMIHDILKTRANNTVTHINYNVIPVTTNI